MDGSIANDAKTLDVPAVMADLGRRAKAAAAELASAPAAARDAALRAAADALDDDWVARTAALLLRGLVAA